LQNTRFFACINLQDNDNDDDDDGDNTNNDILLSSSSMAPVQLSLEVTPTVSAVAITQRLVFDRVSFNVFDDRAPRVQQTAGWTLRMEQPSSSSSLQGGGSGGSSDNHETTDAISSTTTTTTTTTTNRPRITLAGAWQLNRALAIKGKLQDDQSLTLALIMKRWKHPRVTCSVLGHYHWPTRQATWLGVGLEVESGRLAYPAPSGSSNAGTAGSSSSTTEKSASSSSSASASPNSNMHAPPTQIKLPRHDL
jgi:hypothetical protein